MEKTVESIVVAAAARVKVSATAAASTITRGRSTEAITRIGMA